MLEIENLNVSYGMARVLKDVSLSVREGEVTALIGPNGAGKTTLLKTIAGLMGHQKGSLRYCGLDMRDMSPEERIKLGISIVPENKELFRRMTVRDNLLLGGYVLLREGKKREVLEQIEKVYSLFPVLQEKEKVRAGALSGGQQQMLAIGRSLVSKCRFLMLDELSTGLAPLVIKQVMETLAALRKEGITVFLVEQNAQTAFNVSQHVYVLETGNLVLGGTPSDLLSSEDIHKHYLGKGS